MPQAMSDEDLHIMVSQLDDGRWRASVTFGSAVAAESERRDQAIRTVKAMALRKVAKQVERGEQIHRISFYVIERRPPAPVRGEAQ